MKFAILSTIVGLSLSTVNSCDKCQKKAKLAAVGPNSGSIINNSIGKNNVNAQFIDGVQYGRSGAPSLDSQTVFGTIQNGIQVESGLPGQNLNLGNDISLNNIRKFQSQHQTAGHRLSQLDRIKSKITQSSENSFDNDIYLQQQNRQDIEDSVFDPNQMRVQFQQKIKGGGSSSASGQSSSTISVNKAIDFNNIYSQQSKQVLRQAYFDAMGPTQTFNSIFVKFPTCTQVDNIIITGDSAAILKIIQKVSSDTSVTCQQRINYLMELLGRLRTAIEKKVKLGDQLKIVIQSSMAQIKKLSAQVEQTKRTIAQLEVQKVKQSQRGYNKELEQSYNKLNQIDAQAPILKAKSLGIQKQIQILTKDNQTQRSKIASHKLQLTRLRSQISAIQTKLTQLEDKKVLLGDSAQKGQGKIAENQEKVKVLKRKIMEIEGQMKGYRDNYDIVNSAVQDLEVKVERTRADIAVAQSKKNKYTKQLQILESKISTQKKKSVPDSLSKLNEMVSNMRDLVPSVQKAIQTHYYNCYGAGSNIKIENVGNVTIYIVSGDRFGDYIRNLYGQNIGAIDNGDIAFNKVNIFGNDWSSVYGYPFMDNAFGSADFTFAGSFGCLNSGSTSKGWGTITSIGANFIQAQDETGKNSRFNLGSCSRLQSTNKVPKVGQKFYWSGALGSRGYNLFSGSCV